MEIPGAQLGQNVYCGTLGALSGQIQFRLEVQLGHSRGTNDLKHSLGKLNTLGAQLGQKLLGAQLKPEEANWQR